MMFLFCLVTVWEGVDVGVVEKWVVSISPGELLVPGPHVLIGLEFRPLVCVRVNKDEGWEVGGNDAGNGTKEESSPPLLPATICKTIKKKEFRSGGQKGPPHFSEQPKQVFFS